MSDAGSMRWNAQVVPPSEADPEQHPAYFRRNQEAPPAAVLVFHGIGEELRFETLSRAASLLLVEAENRRATVESVVIRSVPRDAAANDLEVRAELSWTESNGTKRQVHVYESYWAPLTLGKVTYWETVRFLAASGWNGIRGAFFSGRFGTFQRWLFGQFRTLKVSLGTVPLLATLMLMVGFVAAIIAMAAAAVPGVAKQVGSGDARRDFANAAGFIYHQIAIPLNEIVRFVGSVVANVEGRSEQPSWINHLLFYPDVSREHLGQAVLAFVLWVGLVTLAYWVRNLLTIYAGSLVAYLSPYKDSKFEDLRHQIQQRGLDLASLVYDGHEFPSGWIPRYNEIVILGHSLGSVIAYDTLNAMINKQAAKLHSGVPNPVIERTKALITFGSPLDKTAFLFRAQLKIGRTRLDREGELRETMVSAVQPLITDYPMYRCNPVPPPRRPRWINLWSRMDVISGSLDYYDDPSILPNDPRHVQNQIDRGAWKPIAAHNQYWTTKLLRQSVYSELF
jgi:hypothetical protein